MYEDLDPIFENHFDLEIEKMTPEEVQEIETLDSVSEFLEDFSSFEFSEESRISRFSYRGEA